MAISWYTMWTCGWWTKLSNTMVRFSCCVRFSKFVLPERLANELPQIVKILECLDLIDCTMVHVLDLFRDPGPDNRV